MRPVFVALGVFLVVIGVLSIQYPHRMRNYVSAHEWQTNPERAKQKQEMYARLAGIFLIFGLGSMLIFFGLVF